jgi:DNA-binding response OmpR family regulator
MSGKPKLLVVEDEALIALELETILLELGCECVGPVTGLAEGLRHAQTAEVDGAVVNLVLDGKPAYPIAEVLERRGIPFGFASGVPQTAIPPEWGDRPFLDKPYSLEHARQLVEAVLGRAVQASSSPGHQDKRSITAPTYAAKQMGPESH